MSATLRQVAYGCAYMVRSFSGYHVNEYRFHTTRHEKSQPNQKTINLVVLTQRLDGVEYYEELMKYMNTRFMDVNHIILSYSNVIDLILK